jgi:hypothetical protein
MDDIDPKEEGDEETPENIDELILSEMDDLEDADEEGFGSGAFSSY